MNILKQTLIIGLCIVLNASTCVYAAKLYIQAPKTASSNGAPLSLSVILDSEEETVSGLSGDFSFSAELFDVASISTNGSIISLWGEAPNVSVDNYFDGRTHIQFEGIIPGGFSGVRSAYTKERSPGVLFTITLIPKASGRDSFLLSNVEIHNYDEKATLIGSAEDSSTIFVPKLTGIASTHDTQKEEIYNDTLSVIFYQNELIDSNATYLYISDSDSSHAISYIEIAESYKYNPDSIRDNEWQKASNPYILKNQARNKFVHVRVFYTNNTYTVETIPPVENLTYISPLSRILIGILVVVFLLLYYGKQNRHLFSKSRHS